MVPVELMGDAFWNSLFGGGSFMAISYHRNRKNQSDNMYEINKKFSFEREKMVIIHKTSIDFSGII